MAVAVGAAVVEDVLAEGYVIEHRGRMGAAVDGFIRGWYFDPQRPSYQPEVELVVDGTVVAVTAADQFRRDLLDNGLGDGAHGYTFRLPPSVYDSQPHEIGVRVTGEKAFLRRPINDLRLREADLPDFRTVVTAFEQGVVRGYCYNANAPSQVLTVLVCRNDEPVRRVLANRSDSGADEAVGHGFLIPIADAGADLFRDSIRLEIAESGEVLDLGVEDLGRAAIWIEVTKVTRHLIEGQVVLPGTVAPDDTFELFRDGDIADVLTAHVTDGPLTRYPFTVPLDEGKKAHATLLAARDAATGQPVGVPVPITLPMSENLLANEALRDWEANRPAAWTLSEMAAAIALPGEGAGGGGIRFNCVELDRSARLELMSQTISLSLLDPVSRPLDLMVDQHASDATVLEFTLHLHLRTGETKTMVVDATAPRGWSSRSARIVLPLAAGEYLPEARLSLALVGPIPASYGLTRIGIGTPGFALSEDGDTVPEWAAINAVRHSSFTSWAGPFRQHANARQIAFSEGWTLVSRNVNPDLELWLDRVEARDPAKGIGAREVYALSVKGPIAAGAARIDAELDAAAMFRRVPNELSFYAATRKAGQIYQIQVFVRRTSPEDPTRSVDTRVATLARRVNLTITGRFETRTISTEIGLAIQAAARETVGNPGSKLFLAFEFVGDIDCTITEVSLSRSRHVEAVMAPGFVGFEDPRITHQLAKLKMVAGWASDEALAASGAPAAAVPMPVKWARPSRATPSVDIVVCVYNAHDEVLACMTSIVENTTVPYTLTIIDDGSEYLTAAMLARFAEGRPWVRLKPNPQNLGYTRSANIGMAGSDAAWVVLLNSDTIVTPGWLEGMLDCALSDPKIALVGPVSNAATWQSVPDVRDSRGGWKVNTLPAGMTPADMAELVHRHSVRERPEVPLLNGFCTLMKTAVLEEIGYLDEKSFPTGYGEESDLCVRVARAGYKLVIADDVYVYHSKSASFGSERRRELSKAGNASLLAKHPETDFQALQGELAEAAPMIRLRKALRQVVGEM